MVYVGLSRLYRGQEMAYVGLSRLYRGQDITILDLNRLYQQEMLHLGLDHPIQDRGRVWYV